MKTGEEILVEYAQQRCGDRFFPKFGMAPVAAARILPILFSGLVPFERLMNIPGTGKKD